MHMSQTKVIFRVYGNNEVVAIFPEDLGTTNPYTCSAYTHIGQHFSVFPDSLIGETKPCPEDLYKDLKEELESIGYNLKVIKRYRGDHLVFRMNQLKEIQGN